MIGRGKRAQTAVEVSVLVFLIAVIMVGYIVLLPEADRTALLNGESSSSTGTSSSSSSAQTLLSESPGDVQSAKSTTQTRDLEPIRLYSSTKSDTQSLAASLTISRNIIQDNYKVIDFDVSNLAALKDTQLLFLISDSKGDLTITINGHTIYEGPMTSNELPLDIPTSYLMDTGNELKLSTDLTWNIFSPHFYQLQDIQLIEDYTVADTSASRTFSIDTPADVTAATLTYFITCNADKEGILGISLNSHEVFSDQVFCNYLNQRELSLDTDYLKTSNSLTFDITEGDYNIEEAQVEIKSKTKDYPSFSFDIDSDLYSEISSGQKDVYLQMTFDDSSSQKEGTILVQQYSFDFNTEDGSYEKKISSYVDDGSNTITLEPASDFTIDNLKVYIE